jgi:SAM-dependent methyltransferase
MSTFNRELRQKLQVIKEFGCEPDNKSVILDFGCGSGRSVQELREHGYQAYGCDMSFKQGTNVDTTSLIDRKEIRIINAEPYTIPFDDNTFDFIFSDEVFEHVFNFSEAIAEIKRVLKPDGYCYHQFSSKYALIESHSLVPFAGIFYPYWWLYLWAALGVKRIKKKGFSNKEFADHYVDRMTNNVNYLSKRQIKEHFQEYF